MLPLIRTLLFLSALVPFFCKIPIASALTPDEVVVVANTDATDSLRLARYYMKRRAIPRENLIKIQSTWNESCDRKEYDERIAAPIRKALTKLRATKQIRCIVSMYGVPLKIRPPALDFEDQEEVEKIRQQIEQQQQELETSDEQEQLRIKDNIKSLEQQKDRLLQINLRASVDSELALVLTPDYPLANGLPNPYFLRFKNETLFLKRNDVLIASRLDGPTSGTVRRIIDDSIAVEREGLHGKAYFDARWKKPEAAKPQTSKAHNGYNFYDAAIHNAATKLAEQRKLSVVIDDRSELFPNGSCPDAALYCGWYSLAEYVDAFNWVPGSIGYHIASSECTTLKSENSQVWCKRMLEEGVAATIGPVYEPFVQAFPPPDLFFTKLTEGYLTLGEVYLISLPYLSWQMVLIGDPLYHPFKPEEAH